MGELVNKKSESGVNTYLLVPILIFFVLLIFAVIRGPNLISSAGIGSAVIVVAPLILATYALTIIVMAGRAGVDLSIGPLIGFINVGMIQLHAAGFMESPIAFFLYAMGVGVIYQLFVGLIIIFVRVQPIIVSLSGYLALVGLNLIVMPRPGGVAPEWMFSWGAGTSIFSATLVILVLATAAWYLIARTAFFGHLRLMGSDERTAYTSGVRINMVRLGAHAIGGVYAGLAAIAFTALISSGDPSQGTTYTLMAVTALVLGGANLAGGRGGAFGSLLGALNIYLITYALSTFNFGTVQSYVTDLAYGVMLVVSLLISVAVPQIRKYISNLSPLVFFVILAVIALGVIMHTSMDQQMAPLVGFAAASVIILSDGGVVQGTAANADAYSAGTYFLFVVIGFVVVSYAFRQLFKHFNASMIGFMIILVITALGLIFNPEKADDVKETASIGLAPIGLDAYSPNYDAMEVIESSGVSLNQDLVQSYFAVISIIGVVLLASLIILVMLPHVKVRTKRVASLLFVFVVAIVAFGALFFDGPEQAYLVGNLPGDIYAVVLVGTGLFILTAPLLHTKFSNISNVFIVSIGVLAIISVYFFTEPNNPDVDGRVTSQAPIYAAPVLATSSKIIAPADIEYESLAIKVDDDKEPMAVYMQVAYSAFIIVMLHVFLQIAMGEFSFRCFWRYWYIPVMASFVWGSLFYAIGIPLWQIVLVIGIAIMAAPNVMHIIGTYIVKQRRDRAISQWDG
jgi:ribose transport system permease protein